MLSIQETVHERAKRLLLFSDTWCGLTQTWHQRGAFSTTRLWFRREIMIWFEIFLKEQSFFIFSLVNLYIAITEQSWLLTWKRWEFMLTEPSLIIIEMFWVLVISNQRLQLFQKYETQRNQWLLINTFQILCHFSILKTSIILKTYNSSILRCTSVYCIRISG